MLALRVGTGAVLCAHGGQKLFGWFGGGGIEGTAAAMDHMGYRPGKANAVMAGLGEFGGGAALALGLGTPVAGAAAAGTMAGAAAVHAPSGFFAQEGGLEYPAFLGFAAAAVGLSGAGRLSLDHLTRHRYDKAWMVLAAFAGTGLAVRAVLRKRDADVAAAEAAEEREADEESAGLR
ncbi:RpiR family transcriptional regulator [Mangrovactinospora gilvigrisea]|uniref:RpiR family transcriptional regulator n=1 Tax=Mangrovactinospora gilvigrisea TaxID=1428644 RepID=A0A1J7BAX9_9ACTN|nr:DoxX family protein [Mangrovactinospora gilvigrisea]OIV35765.1 RpiR family transcriptional regulator [Mangrovactinospora gilvigrisea]